MRKFLTLPFLLFTVLCFGQKGKPTKWIENGCGWMMMGSQPKDTITNCYVLEGKDSLTYTIATNNCNCDFYTTIGDHKTKSCKGLKLHTIETHFMYWTKDVTFVKGVKLSETNPHWDSNSGQMSTIEGVYEQNGKVAYVHSIHLLKHKLLNDKQPYKFAPEWVTLNDY